MVNLLLCFSVVKNTKAILKIDVPEDSITSINGIRTLSITWVILGHSLLYGVVCQKVTERDQLTVNYFR